MCGECIDTLVKKDMQDPISGEKLEASDLVPIKKVRAAKDTNR